LPTNTAFDVIRPDAVKIPVAAGAVGVASPPAEEFFCFQPMTNEPPKV
jgi:hypothetical protein